MRKHTSPPSSSFDVLEESAEDFPSHGEGYRIDSTMVQVREIFKLLAGMLHRHPWMTSLDLIFPTTTSVKGRASRILFESYISVLLSSFPYKQIKPVAKHESATSQRQITIKLPDVGMLGGGVD
jgi:hypothetical protein